MKATKIILSAIVLVLTSLTFVQSCKKGNTADLSGTYELKVNESNPMSASENAVTITLLSVNDSRCPINANCISTGSAIVNAKIKDNLGEQTIHLCIGGDCADSKTTVKPTVRLNGVMYNYMLKEVTPFPEYPVINTEKTAVIIFSKH